MRSIVSGRKRGAISVEVHARGAPRGKGMADQLRSAGAATRLQALAGASSVAPDEPYPLAVDLDAVAVADRVSLPCRAIVARSRAAMNFDQRKVGPHWPSAGARPVGDVRTELLTARGRNGAEVCETPTCCGKRKLPACGNRNRAPSFLEWRYSIRTRR